MTTEEKKQYIPAIAAIIMAIAICIKWQCEPTLNVPPTPRDKIITKIDTLKVHDKVLVEKWHKAIHTTDSVVKLVYFSAPDTCKSYLDTMQVLFNSERESVQKVVISKDSIIASYTALSKSDSITISILQTDTTTLRKQVKKLRKRGKVVFGLGYVLGLVTSVIFK